MSASVRDLLDGNQPISVTTTTAMTWLAPDSRAPCPVAKSAISDGGAHVVKRCVLVGRHDHHDMREQP